MTFSPSDKAAMLAELARDGTTVDLEPGSTWTVSGRLAIGEGTELQGNGATLIAPGDASRLWIENPGVTIHNLQGFGFLTLYAYAGNLTVEDVALRHTLPGSDEYLNLGAKGGATAAFMVWGRGGTTLHNLTFRRCTAEKTYHHGFSLNLSNANEGGGFADVLFEDCQALSSGSGFEGGGARDWSCGFDIPDAGDVTRMTVRNCLADDPWQDGFHLDGSWDGHRQTITDVLFEGCRATNAGRRCSDASVEKFWSGFYLPSGRLVGCHSGNCRHAGFAFKNEVANSLIVEDCFDVDSTYGMIAEYPCNGARIEFESIGAGYRAFQGQITGAGSILDLTLSEPPENPVLLGRTARVDFLDCPNHQADVDGKYASLGYGVNASGITIRAAETPTVDVWRNSYLKGSITFLALDTEPVIVPDDPEPPVAEGNDTTVPPPVILPPDPATLGRFKRFEGAVYWSPDGKTWTQLQTPFLPDAALPYFLAGVPYGPVRE